MNMVSGKSLVFFATVVPLLALAYAIQQSGDYVRALPYVMWPTAHIAFALFWMAFTASSFNTLAPGQYSKWAMKNRRYIGLSFAAMHFIHLVLVLSNITLTAEAREWYVLLAGGAAYSFLGLMALTSNNAAMKKLGTKNWKRLHWVGSWYIWAIFISSMPELLDGHYRRAWVFSFCLIALALRIMAYYKLKSRAG